MTYSTDPILGRLSEDQLRAGIARGKEQLAVLEGNLAIDAGLFTDHGAFDRPSKQFEAWSNADYESRRRHLLFAIAETERELGRRGDNRKAA